MGKRQLLEKGGTNTPVLKLK